MPKIIF